MSLFVVNRYQGNEETVSLDSTNADDHLTALLKKIEERKKRLNKTNENDSENQSQNLQKTIPSSKKRKKRKTSTTPNDDDDVINKTKEDDTAGDKTPEIVPETAPRKEKVATKKPQDFLILGSDSHKKNQTAKRVLPTWLLKPELISSDLNSGPPLEDLKFVLDDGLINVLKENGTKKLFPVQASLIPWILECDTHRKANWWPQDVCVSAPTGSGKTLAYVLPIVQQLQFRLVRKVRCLIVLPVQELAAQVYKVMTNYTAHTKLKVALLSTTAFFPREQNSLVKKTGNGKHSSKVDIIVTTSDRLIKHIEKTEGFSLASLRFLVIDEADKSTEWLHRLPPPHNSIAPRTISSFESGANQPAQKLLFSATLSQDPEKLSRLGLFQPKLFTSVLPEDKDYDLNLDKEGGDFAGRYTSPDELVERAVECEPLYKPLALYQLLVENDELHKTLVFVNSGHIAHKLCLMIRILGKEKGITVAEISALLAPSKREQVVKEFTQGQVQVLISSDALARGMDIPDVKLVVSYDCPKHIKAYIHRSGRTGRAGNAGTAVSLLMPRQVPAFSRMLTSARKNVPQIEKMDLESLAESTEYEKHIDILKETIIREEAENLNRLKAVKRKHKTQASH